MKTGLLLGIFLVLVVMLYFLIPKVTHEIKVYCSGNVSCWKNIVYGEKYARFNITIPVSEKFNGWRVQCYCEKFNNEEHPLKGKVCGGYGIVKDGNATITGWEIDFDPGNNMTFSCWLERNEKKKFLTKIVVVSVKGFYKKS